MDASRGGFKEDGIQETMREEYLMQDAKDKNGCPIVWTPAVFTPTVHQLPRCGILPFKWNHPKKVGNPNCPTTTKANSFVE